MSVPSRASIARRFLATLTAAPALRIRLRRSFICETVVPLLWATTITPAVLNTVLSVETSSLFSALSTCSLLLHGSLRRECPPLDLPRGSCPRGAHACPPSGSLICFSRTSGFERSKPNLKPCGQRTVCLPSHAGWWFKRTYSPAPAISDRFLIPLP